MNRSTWTWALVTLSLAIAGCSEKATVEAKTPPPPPPPAAPADSDGDGIPDDVDKCIGQKEDGLPPDPKDGCPTTDPDGDGIVGDKDKCPNDPETKNGFQDEDGCPDEPPRVSVTKTEVKITEKIHFAFGKATIEEKSNSLIDEIAGAIINNPQIEYIEVAGHADKIGTDPFNVNLTRQRAQAVATALTKRGVEARRMRSVGYGRYCPLDKADTDQARERNRRVEFKILRVDGVETGVQLGCEDAASKGIKPAGVAKNAPTRADNEKQQEAAKEKLAKVVADDKEKAKAAKTAAKDKDKGEGKSAKADGASAKAKGDKDKGDKDKGDKDKGDKDKGDKKDKTTKAAPAPKTPPGKLGPVNAPAP